MAGVTTDSILHLPDAWFRYVHDLRAWPIFPGLHALNQQAWVVRFRPGSILGTAFGV